MKKNRFPSIQPSLVALVFIAFVFNVLPVRAMEDPTINNEELKTTTLEDQLFLACKTGDLEQIKTLTEQGANLDATNEQGDRGLTIALKSGFPNIALHLLDCGADYNFPITLDPLYICPVPLNYQSPPKNRQEFKRRGNLIHLASKLGMIEVVQVLIERGIDINTPDYVHCTQPESWRFQNSPLGYALEYKQLKVAKYLLKHGCDKKDDYFRYFFWKILGLDRDNPVLTYGEIQPILSLLVKNGANVNLYWPAFEMPYLYIANYGCLTHEDLRPLSSDLIDWGADIHALGIGGENALMAAVRKELSEVAMKLILKGINILHTDERGNTVLDVVAPPINDIAYPKNQQIFANYFINAGVSSAKIQTYFFEYIRRNCNDLVITCLEKNLIDVNAQTENGYTALMLEAEKNNLEIINLLIKNGANINARNKNGRNVMYGAAAEPDIVNILLSNGAESLVVDENGESPLQWAVEDQEDYLVKSLLTKSLYTQKNYLEKGQLKDICLKKLILDNQLNIVDRKLRAYLLGDLKPTRSIERVLLINDFINDITENKLEHQTTTKIINKIGKRYFQQMQKFLQLTNNENKRPIDYAKDDPNIKNYLEMFEPEKSFANLPSDIKKQIFQTIKDSGSKIYGN